MEKEKKFLRIINPILLVILGLFIRWLVSALLVFPILDNYRSPNIIFYFLPLFLSTFFIGIIAKRKWWIYGIIIPIIDLPLFILGDLGIHSSLIHRLFFGFSVVIALFTSLLGFLLRKLLSKITIMKMKRIMRIVWLLTIVLFGYNVLLIFTYLVGRFTFEIMYPLIISLIILFVISILLSFINSKYKILNRKQFILFLIIRIYSTVLFSIFFVVPFIFLLIQAFQFPY